MTSIRELTGLIGRNTIVGQEFTGGTLGIETANDQRSLSKAVDEMKCVTKVQSGIRGTQNILVRNFNPNVDGKSVCTGCDRLKDRSTGCEIYEGLTP